MLGVSRRKPCSSLLAQGRDLAVPACRMLRLGLCPACFQACHLPLSLLCANRCKGPGWILLSDIPKTLTEVAVRKHCPWQRCPLVPFHPGVRSFSFSVTTSTCSTCG